MLDRDILYSFEFRLMTAIFFERTFYSNADEIDARRYERRIIDANYLSVGLSRFLKNEFRYEFRRNKLQKLRFVYVVSILTVFFVLLENNNEVTFNEFQY